MSEGQRSESLGIKSGGCVSPCFARELDGKGDKGGEKKRNIIYFHLFESRLIFADKIFKGLEIRN